MAKTPEGKVKDAVVKILKQHKVHYFMPVQSGYGSPHLDFICCHLGYFFAIETKAPGKKATERQELTMRQVSLAGGRSLVIDGKESGNLAPLVDLLTEFEEMRDAALKNPP